MGQLTTVLLFIELLPKKNTQNFDQKVHQQSKIFCLEQQIYASSESFTPTLLVMLEIFRRSDVHMYIVLPQQATVPVSSLTHGHREGYTVLKGGTGNWYKILYKRPPSSSDND